jgi:hypothetical protein
MHSTECVKITVAVQFCQYHTAGQLQLSFSARRPGFTEMTNKEINYTYFHCGLLDYELDVTFSMQIKQWLQI